MLSELSLRRVADNCPVAWSYALKNLLGTVWRLRLLKLSRNLAKAFVRVVTLGRGLI